MSKLLTKLLSMLRSVQTTEVEADEVIDWANIPTNTLILVKDTEYGEEYIRHLALYLPNSTSEFLTFRGADNLYTAGNVKQWEYGRLHPDVEIKEEWVKQEKQMKTISDEDFDLLNTVHKAIKGTSIHTLKHSGVQEKWEPKKQEYYFATDGDVESTIRHDYTQCGRERSTRELCKIASDRTIEANRLSAWLDEFGSGEQEFKDNICFIHKGSDGEWCIWSSTAHEVGLIYMTEKDAIALCEYLNNGGEL